MQTASQNSGSTGPLAGITVVDLSRVLSGPYCTMLLADMGARVIKVEQPGRGDDTRAWGPPFIGTESAYFLSINRNKESFTLDLKKPQAQRIIQRLVERADVLVENFRPGTLDRLNLGYNQLRLTHPRLVYCSVSGFGQTGPQRDRPGYDAVVQAEGGLMSITGPADGPAYRLGVAIADIVAGMFAAHGITLALLARERSGQGQQVDIGMLDAVVSLLTYQASSYFATGESPKRMGNRHPTIVPYETFETADGEFVVAVGNDDLWKRFCAAIELGDVATDIRFARNQDRVRNYDALRPVLGNHLKQQTRAHWIERLSRAGVPCGGVRSIEEVLNDAQVLARGMVHNLTHASVGGVGVVGVPIKLSSTPGSVRTAPPTLGEHTEDILVTDLAYTREDVANLRNDGVI
jgi:crotonobetainyl-CoA:carnitine CoA-transferase CaiB-like acyl-CoA transferase